MLNDFFKPLKEPVEKGREFLFFFLFLMVMSRIIGYFAHTFLIFILSLISCTVIYAVVYCIIKNKKNEKD